MTAIKTIEPSAHFPFSHAVVHGGLVYVSGQVGFETGTTKLAAADLAGQARQTFANIDRVLAAAATSRDRIIRCGVYLKHAERDFKAFNDRYAAWLGDHRPARSTIQANLAGADILLEVDCIAAAG